MTLTASEAIVLESYVDKYGIDGLLQALAHICDLKATHCAENWGDTFLAKRWAEAAIDLEGALAKEPEL